MEIHERVSRLEVQMADVRDDIGEIKEQMHLTATKDDVKELQGFFEKRDSLFVRNMWKVVYGLLGLFAALIITVLGLSGFPNPFGGG